MRKNEIGWRDEDEEGNKIEMLAVRDRTGYTFSYLPKGEEEWIDIPRPTRDQVQALHDILDQRYRRRRASYKEVEYVQKMLRKMP